MPYFLYYLMVSQKKGIWGGFIHSMMVGIPGVYSVLGKGILCTKEDYMHRHCLAYWDNRSLKLVYRESSEWTSVACPGGEAPLQWLCPCLFQRLREKIFVHLLLGRKSCVYRSGISHPRHMGEQDFYLATHMLSLILQ